MRLYLPQQWADDAARRKKAGVPEDIVFQSKPEIALEQLRWACQSGLARGVVLLDAGYGNHTRLRDEIGDLGLSYAAGILSSTTVWAPGEAPLPPKRWSGRGRHPTRLRRHAKHKPVSAKTLALLGHFEGRGWRGFHHHATLCIAAYGCLISERETIPPSGPRPTRRRQESQLPQGYRPRGAAPSTPTPHS